MKQCMGCMEIYQDNANVCPCCGYVEGTQPENTLHIQPGSILNNRYIIGKVLGYGGFGVTYIAWDSLLEQKVAIKEFLPSEFATRMLGRMEITIFSGDKEKQFMEGLIKFVEEAKKLAKFNNVPGIIKIFDCIEENNTAYIIMELLEGETLAERLEHEKKMSADKAISMLLPVMESLRIVNAAGIIHRDIAPDNIFITKQNDIKLIDFGAARYATTSLSRSLTIIIKPGYSPEEQYRSMGDQGSWTDVYSIGATLYRMITGETPCDSMERRAYMEQNGTDMLKPISKFSNRISKNQEVAILNAMNIKVEERTKDMTRLMEELTAVTDIQRIESKERKINMIDLPLWVKIAGVVAAVVVVIIAFIVGRRGSTTFEETGMTRVPNLINLSIDEAISELKENNLSYRIIGYTYSATLPANSVIYQSKEVGTKITQNSQIDIKVSKIRDTYEVSNVVAMDQKKAAEILSTDGYDVQIGATVYNDVIAPNCVITQETNETNKKTVALTISKGPSQRIPYGIIDTPDFKGKNIIDVLKEAKELGVLIEVIERKAGESEDGEVLDEGNVKGYNTRPNRIKTGSIIQLLVSAGNNQVKISDYTNMKIDDVCNLLIPRGIKVEEECELVDGFDQGIIFGQDVKEGAILQTGDTITLKVSIGSEKFRMIDVVGKEEDEAVRLLKRYGLKVETKDGYSKYIEEGFVISQSIESKKEAKVGDRITLIICNPSGNIMLPNMVGEDIDSIVEKLESQGITVVKNAVFDESFEKGKIISASPDKNELVPVGGKVELTYSRGPGDIPQVLSVVGKDLEEAKETLEGQQNLVVVAVYEFDNNQDTIGKITKQDIFNERASSGDVVTVTINKGPEAVIELKPQKLNIKVGEGGAIYTESTPTSVKIEWEAADDEIVRIDPSTSSYESEGKVCWNANITGLKAGRTKVTARVTYIDNTVTEKTCEIYVN